MRAASEPWGPWSDVEIVFHPWKDKGYGHFIHGLSWYGASADKLTDLGRASQWGGEYGPYIMARYTTGDADGCRIYYVMSTRNPHQVVVMRTDLKLEETRPGKDKQANGDEPNQSRTSGTRPIEVTGTPGNRTILPRGHRTYIVRGRPSATGSGAGQPSSAQ